MLHMNSLAPDGTVALRCRRAIVSLFPLFCCHDAPQAAGADGTGLYFCFSQHFCPLSSAHTSYRGRGEREKVEGGGEKRRERGMLLIRIYATNMIIC
jgi:hypothetical protein